jgi:soluble lytic murein transglycosylase-like protein
MATKNSLTVNVPSPGLSAPKSWGSRAQIKSMLERISNNYGSFIKTASENSRIPRSVLAAFIAVESGGKADAGPAGHITQGLMQWNRSYAKKQLERELSRNRMTPEEKQKLASFGITFNDKGLTREITNADQLKPELNILIGSIVLGQLIDTEWGTVNGQLMLDRVITVYNAGQYGDSGKKATSGLYKTPAELAAVVNPISASYIGKIMGRDGALDIATQELKNLFS